MAMTLLAAQNYACFYCKRKFTPHDKPTRDHLWPRVAGQSLKDNKVLACVKCNSRKGARLPRANEVERARQLYRKMGRQLMQMGSEGQDSMTPSAREG